MIQRVYTTKQVADLLGIQEETVRVYCRTGKFAGAFRLSGSRSPWRITETDLNVWMGARPSNQVESFPRITRRRGRRNRNVNKETRD